MFRVRVMRKQRVGSTACTCMMSYGNRFPRGVPTVLTGGARLRTTRGPGKAGLKTICFSASIATGNGFKAFGMSSPTTLFTRGGSKGLVLAMASTLVGGSLGDLAMCASIPIENRKIDGRSGGVCRVGVPLPTKTRYKRPTAMALRLL